jgi:hypothetical protein
MNITKQLCTSFGVHIYPLCSASCYNNSGVDDPDVNKDNIYEVMVCLGKLTFEGPNGQATTEDLIFSPHVIGDTTSGTIMVWMKKVLLQVGIDIEELCRSVELVLFNIGVDGHPVNTLAIGSLIENTPDNCLVFKNPCWMHKSGRVTMDNLTKSGFGLINPMFSLSHLVEIGMTFNQFVSSCLLVAENDARSNWRQYMEPDPADLQYNVAIVRLTVPDYHTSTFRQEQLQEPLRILNHRFTGKVGHSCYIVIHLAAK